MRDPGWHAGREDLRRDLPERRPEPGRLPLRRLCCLLRRALRVLCLAQRVQRLVPLLVQLLPELVPRGRGGGALEPADLQPGRQLRVLALERLEPEVCGRMGGVRPRRTRGSDGRTMSANHPPLAPTDLACSVAFWDVRSAESRSKACVMMCLSCWMARISLSSLSMSSDLRASASAAPTSCRVRWLVSRAPPLTMAYGRWPAGALLLSCNRRKENCRVNFELGVRRAFFS